MFRRVDLPSSIPGRLYLHHMPGRPDRESWNDFESVARSAKIASIVSVAPFEEIHRKSPEYATRISDGTLPFSHCIVPIPDFGIPEDRDELASTAVKAAEALRSGCNILIHCGAGIGRTGLFAGCVLLALGYNQPDATRMVREAGATCETVAQMSVLDWFADQLRLSNS